MTQTALPLAGCHIILGITGGIAAYKSVSLLRLLVKAGAEVQVVMTPAAREFITPVTLSSLSGKPVVSEFFTANTGEWHSHVNLGLWADLMVIAPCTASTLGKMAHGVADNMLVTTYLSAKCPVMIAPAMDLDMMAHPSTTANISLLRSYGNIIIEPAAGELASHLVGRGRMEEPENIVTAVLNHFRTSRTLNGKNVLITAGPTYERIDPVRFIGNFSTGKMGYALAQKAAEMGAEVFLVSGPVSIPEPAHSNVNTTHVESAREMEKAVREIFPRCDIAILAAAVADYAPAHTYDRKIKREHADITEIPVVKNPDIAAGLGKIKSHGQVLVGFALETNDAVENGRRKISNKNLDAIVVNTLEDKGAGFGTDTNCVTVLFADPERQDIRIPLKTKTEVAGDILSILSDL